MQLVDKGKLDLDAPVQKYLLSFPVKQWTLTTRHLLGHLGGIRSYKDLYETYNTRHYPSVADALNLFEQDPLLQEPGTTYAYSTYGYVLAGRVVEIAAGEPYLDYMQISSRRRHEGHPSRQRVPLDPKPCARLSGAAGWRDRKLRTARHQWSSPGGGFSSTAGDLVRFALAFDTGKLLTKGSMEAMTRPMSTRDGKSTGYGLGWGVHERLGRRHLSHSGGQSGVSTLLVYLPTQHVALALMINLEGQSLQGLTDRIVDLLFEP
ncbi:MAG: serine hydrolase domain-containing protein [Bryobacteraceae bacterium]